MVSTLFGFQIVSRDDPLANVKSITAWSARLPGNDPVGASEAMVRLLQTASASPPVATLTRLQAVLELDRISAPLQAQLRTQYRMRAMSDEVRQRLWRAGDDLARWFAHVYEGIYQGMLVPGRQQKAHAELHGIFARMLHYVGVQTRQGLFRYERWSPAKWRLLHSAYREAREQGVVAAPYTLDESTPPADRLSPEQEYLQILLLQRINTGNLSAQQIDWAAEWLREWVPALWLAMKPFEGDGFWLDPGRGEGLVTRRPQRPTGELLYLDVAPLRGQLSSLLARLEAQAGAKPGHDERDEQLTLARHLDRLWLPRAPELVRRGERQAARHNVAVAAGWAEIVVALAARAVQKAGALQGHHHYYDYGRSRLHKDGRRSARDPNKSDLGVWQIHDTSDSGFRLRSSSRLAARQRPGALLALRLEDYPRWQLGIVRRLKRLSAMQIELGVEIIAPNVTLIMPRALASGDAGDDVGGSDPKGKSFQALYLSPQLRAGATLSPTVMLPPGEFLFGRMLHVLVDGHSHRGSLAAPLERTRDWVWAPLEIVQ